MNKLDDSCLLIEPGTTVTDPLCPGLRLTATESNRSWIYRYRLQTGRLRQIKLGELRNMDLTQAREAWLVQKKLRDNMQDPRVEKEYHAHFMTNLVPA